MAGRMPASSTRAQGRAPGEPRSLLAQSRGQDARVTADARVSFLWLLSFGQAKESNRPPWMADDPHTDVSRSSRRRQRPKAKSKWIPAFAGMTTRMDFGLRRNDGCVDSGLRRNDGCVDSGLRRNDGCVDSG